MPFGSARWLNWFALCAGFALRAGFALCAASASCACSDVNTSLIDARRAEAGRPGDGDGGARNDSGARDGASAGDASTSAGPCGDHPCACDDGIDQDLDELVDGFDPECTGPHDDDESSFGTGRNQGAVPACQDCYWDEDLDGMNDGCAYPRSCTDDNAASSDDSLACTECSVAPMCTRLCQPRATNGCDCFGCCTVTRKNGRTVDVRLQPGCSVDLVDDELACPRCFRNTACYKACGDCELCLGRKRRDLAMGCRGKPSDPAQTPVCDEGEPPCSASSDCPNSTYYCQQGCCLIRVL